MSPRSKTCRNAFLIGLLVAGCTASPRERERAALAAEIGRDPVVILEEMGSAESKISPQFVAAPHQWLTGQQILRLMRFGMSHENAEVVAGATVLATSASQLAIPELATAANAVLPRLGEPGYPLSWNDARPLIGGADFSKLVEVIPRLPERDAVKFLGELHRMSRPDALPALCEIARRSSPAVCNAAFDNVVLTDTYDGRIAPEIVRTWLDLVGIATEPDEPNRLPGELRSALLAWYTLPKEPAPRPGLLDERRPAIPVSVARWFAHSRPGAGDLPMLRQLVQADDFQLATTAAWTLGALTDEESHALLMEEPPDRVAANVWTAARARRGDSEALEELFAGNDDALLFALMLAPTTRRTRFFERLLQLPTPDALETVRSLAAWPRSGIWSSFLTPPYDDRYFVELEAALATTPDVSSRVLRACIDALPACETTRLADVLLNRPTEELFAHEYQDLDRSYLGHGGVWAFLEVTRPQQLTRRLREGFASPTVEVRDLCARLLIALGDTVDLAAMGAWIDTNGSTDDWLTLARDRAPNVEAAVRERLLQRHANDDHDDRLIAALATYQGMPRRAAVSWSIAGGDLPTATAAVLRGDAVTAFLDSRPGLRLLGKALGWQARRVQDYILTARRTLPDHDPSELYSFDQDWTLARGTRPEVDRMLQPVRDGRYATHYGFSAEVAAHAGGLDMLPFWVDELGTNCCKVVFIEEVLEHLFGQDSDAFDHYRRLEPAAAYLRRTLLPVQDRLRWSRIANGYVVAGR